MTEEKQHQFDIRYLKMAKIWAENSYAIRRKVGCLVVRDNMIISDGYNGTPSSFNNECENVTCNCTQKYCKKNIVVNTEKEKVMSPIYCKDCHYATLVTKDEVLHAEANAITKLAKSGNSSEGATIYVTLSPCLNCAKLIAQSGIKRVVYMEKYRITDGLDFLRELGVTVTHITEEEVMGDG